MDIMTDQFSANHTSSLVDPFGRHITYLRLSVTDRCDLRCTYCMPERMKFLPRQDVLTFEELERLTRIFINRGVRKLRLTGGEPLVRKDIGSLIDRLGAFLQNGSLDELTLTTNGIALAKHAAQLSRSGVKRINVSLDTLDPDIFAQLTRREKLGDVLAGIEAAKKEGIHIKLNTVALKGANATQIPSIIEWAHENDMDISLIEVMPMGEIDGDRIDQYLPLTDVRDTIEKKWTLTPDIHRTGGPSRYFQIKETNGRIGFISPLTNNFCDGCNRVRLTCTGKLYLCLGQGDHTDFREIMRQGGTDNDLDDALLEAITRKPKAHNFEIKNANSKPAVDRTMSLTGG